MHNTLLQTYEWFQSARPLPTSKDFHSQVGVHFEEVAEMLDEITGLNEEATSRILLAKLAMRDLATYLKTSDDVIAVEENQVINFLDALCDQIVTATGVGYVSDMDIVSAMDEVNRSNYSKFGDDGLPIFDENKKVIKGPNYSKANLSTFI